MRIKVKWNFTVFLLSVKLYLQTQCNSNAHVVLPEQTYWLSDLGRRTWGVVCVCVCICYPPCRFLLYSRFVLWVSSTSRVIILSTTFRNEVWLNSIKHYTLRTNLFQTLLKVTSPILLVWVGEGVEGVSLFSNRSVKDSLWHTSIN